MMEPQNKRQRKGPMDSGQTDLLDLMRHFEIHNKTEGKSPRTVECTTWPLENSGTG